MPSAVKRNTRLVDKQATTVFPLLLISAQLVSIPFSLQDEFAAKFR